MNIGHLCEGVFVVYLLSQLKIGRNIGGFLC